MYRTWDTHSNNIARLSLPSVTKVAWRNHIVSSNLARHIVPDSSVEITYGFGGDHRKPQVGSVEIACCSVDATGNKKLSSGETACCSFVTIWNNVYVWLILSNRSSNRVGSVETIWNYVRPTIRIHDKHRQYTTDNPNLIAEIDKTGFVRRPTLATVQRQD